MRFDESSSQTQDHNVIIWLDLLSYAAITGTVSQAEKILKKSTQLSRADGAVFSEYVQRHSISVWPSQMLPHDAGSTIVHLDTLRNSVRRGGLDCGLFFGRL